MAIDPVSRNRRSLDFVDDVVRRVTARATPRVEVEAPRAEVEGWAERAVQAVEHVLEQIDVRTPTPQRGATAAASGSERTAGVFANTATPDVAADPTRTAIDALRSLPPPEPAGRGTESVATFLDAMAAREAGEARPEGTPDYVWSGTKALDKQGLTLADVEQYLVDGTLPDLARLESAATQRGSWTAVNSLTFLVQMRRASLNTHVAALAAHRDLLGADDPMRAELDAAIADAEALTRSLRTGLGTIYTAATSAREAKATSLVAEAEDRLIEAATLRADGQTARADALEAEAKALLDSGASIATSEAAYRARQSNAGWNAGDLFALAAQAQTDRGVLENESMIRGGALADTAPAFFGDVADAGNGVAGAAALLERATANDADGGRVLALRDEVAGGVAAFHQAHVLSGGYHEMSLEALETPSGQALVGHREAYLEARAEQLEITGLQLDAFGETSELSATDAARAAQIAKHRRTILEEVTQSIGRGLAAESAADDAMAQLPGIEEAVGEARSAEADAYKRAGAAEEERERIVEQTEAWLGDWAKTSGEERRDRSARSEARSIESFEEAQATFATAQRLGLEVTQSEMTTRADELDAAAGPALVDAQLAKVAFSGYAPRAEEAYASLRAAADDAALDQEDYLDQIDAVMPAGGPEQREADLLVAGLSLDLARYWTASTDLDNAVVGHDASATERLDKADDLLTRADRTRTSLIDGNAGRVALAVGTIEVRSALAEANADYRIGEASHQVDLAEGVLDDLSGELRESAEARVGAAAITSVVRHEGRFDEVLASGGYVPGAADALLASARAHLVGTTDTSDATLEALYRLEKVETALESVDDVLLASRVQLENGHAYAEANIMKIARMEIANAQAQVSSVITGATWLLTFGQVDMKETMAEAGEEAASWRVERSRSAMVTLTDGADQLGDAWTRATNDGEQLELLHSLRILSDDRPEHDDDARRFLEARTGGDDDWEAYVRDAIGGQVPVATAFQGTILGFESSLERLGSHDVAVLTPTMNNTIESAAARLEQVSENMTLMVAFNLTAEFILGVVVTGGLSAEVTAGRAAQAANAINTASEAANGARSLTMMGRAGQALANFKSAHGVLHAMGATTLIGGGMMGASWTARKAFGANTGLARGTDLLLNIALPIAMLRVAKPKQLLDLATQTAKVQQSVGRMSSLMSSLSKDAWKAAAVKYGPDALIGGTQTFSIAMATPWLAQELDLRTEGEQMMLGLALNTLSAGGLAAGYSVAAGHARARGIAKDFDGANVAGVRKALGAFDRIDGMPSAAQLATLEARLTQQLAATTPAKKARVTALVEGLRIERATSRGFADASIVAGNEVTPRDAISALDAAAEQLYASRLEADPSASRAQAYHDAADGVTRALVDGAPALFAEVQTAAVDRANAITIAEAYAPAPQRAKAEAILAESLPALREGVQRSAVDVDAVRARLVDEAGLSPTAADEAVFAAQYQLAVDLVQREVPFLPTDAIADSVFDIAEQTGLSPDAALALTDDLVAKAGFMDWVRSFGPQSTWTASMHRDNFLAVAQRWPKVHAEMSKLTAEQFGAIAMDGAVPTGFFALGDMPGFAALAAKDHINARILADATTLVGFENGAWTLRSEIDQRVQAAGQARLAADPTGPAPGLDPADWNAAGDFAFEHMPKITPSSIVPDYWLAKFEKQSLVAIPKYNLRPAPRHDRSGAFNEGVPLGGRFRTRGKTTTVDFANLGRVKLLDANHQPITDMTKVLVFSGHGSPLTGTISGMSVKKTSAVIAEQIEHASLLGDSIEHVLLDACHQRDKRLYFGSSHAEALKARLNADLASRGLPPVEVLAAKHSGPTYGYGKQRTNWFHRDTQGRLRLGGRDLPTDFRPANYSELHFGALDAALVAGAGTLGGLGVLIGIMATRDEK